MNVDRRKFRASEIGRALGGRAGLPVSVGMAAALLLGTRADDATAASLGGAAGSFGLLTALLAVLVVRAWQTHLLFASLSTLGGLMALVAGVALIWRYAGAPRLPGLTSSAAAVLSRDHAASKASELQIALPQGVDRQHLLAELRRTFMALQSAWDQGAPDQLAQMTTPEMLEELCAARSIGYGIAERSEVLTLEVRLIAFEEVGAAQLACVEFSGLIRESPPAGSEPFRELWMLSRSVDGVGGWRLGRHQALL